MIFGIVLIVAGIGIAASSGGVHHTHGHTNVHVSPPPAHVMHVAGHAWHTGPCSVYPKGHAKHAHKPTPVKKQHTQKHTHKTKNVHKPKQNTRKNKPAAKNRNVSRSKQRQQRSTKR